MKDTNLHTEPDNEIRIGELPKDAKYHKLFILVITCGGFPNRELLEEIVKEVHESFPIENNNTFY